MLNTVITAGTSAGFTSGYDTGVRLRSDGLSFFGRFAVCPLVAFFRGCLAARTVNVIGVPIVIAIVIVGGMCEYKRHAMPSRSARSLVVVVVVVIRGWGWDGL